MSVRPTAAALLEAVSGFIDGAKAELKDRDAFLARVALNALAVVGRELADGPAAAAAAERRLAALLGQAGAVETLEALLCERIRAGAFDADPRALESHLLLTALDQVAIDQPGYSGLRAARARLRARDGSGRGPP